MSSKEKQLAPNRDPAGKIMPFRVKIEAREICEICFEVIRVGYEVPYELTWLPALPPGLQKKNLCLDCFTRYCDEKRIHWDIGIRFFPVSLITKMGR